MNIACKAYYPHTVTACRNISLSMLRWAIIECPPPLTPSITVQLASEQAAHPVAIDYEETDRHLGMRGKKSELQT